MTEITFNNLPEAVTQLRNDISEIKRLLLSKRGEPSPEADQLLTIGEAADLLHLSVPTCYTKVCKRELPVMKQGGRLYFSKRELLDWLIKGRRKMKSEIDQQATDYVHLKNK